MEIINIIFGVLAVLSLALLFIGLIYPFILKSRFKVLLVYGGAYLTFMVLSNITYAGYLSGGENISKATLIEEPNEVINNYYANLANGKYEEAYELLSELDKEKHSKTEFVLYQLIIDKSYHLEKAEIHQYKLYMDKTIFNINFPRIIDYKVKEKSISLLDKEQHNDKYNRKVLLENNTWKVFWEYSGKLNIERYSEEALAVFNKDNTLFDKDFEIALKYLGEFIVQNKLDETSKLFELNRNLLEYKSTYKYEKNDELHDKEEKEERLEKEEKANEQEMNKEKVILGSTKDEICKIFAEYSRNRKYERNVDSEAMKFENEELIIVVDFDENGKAEGVSFTSINYKEFDVMGDGKNSYVNQHYDELMKLATGGKEVKIEKGVSKYPIELYIGNLHD